VSKCCDAQFLGPVLALTRLLRDAALRSPTTTTLLVPSSINICKLGSFCLRSICSILKSLSSYHHTTIHSETIDLSSVNM
jgi:hypothetical protein